MEYLTSRKRRWLILFSAGGMLAYCALAWMVDAERIKHALGTLGLTPILVILGLSLLNYLLRFQRWHWYLGALGHRLPVLRHLAYYMGGFAFTVTPGKAGESVRSIYLHRHGVPYARSLAALFTERLLDALAITALAVLIVIPHQDYRVGVLAAALSFIAATLFAGHGFAPAFLRRMSAGLRGRLRNVLQHLAALFDSSAQLLQPRYLLPGLIIGIIAWGAEGYGLYLLADQLGVELNIWSGTGIYAIAVLAGAATFFMPGGLGGMEAVMTAMLVAAGASLPIAFAITVLCRLATLWFAVVLGLLALLWIESSTRLEPAT